MTENEARKCEELARQVVGLSAEQIAYFLSRLVPEMDARASESDFYDGVSLAMGSGVHDFDRCLCVAASYKRNG